MSEGIWLFTLRYLSVGIDRFFVALFFSACCVCQSTLYIVYCLNCKSAVLSEITVISIKLQICGRQTALMSIPDENNVLFQAIRWNVASSDADGDECVMGSRGQSGLLLVHQTTWQQRLCSTTAICVSSTPPTRPPTMQRRCFFYACTSTSTLLLWQPLSRSMRTMRA